MTSRLIHPFVSPATAEEVVELSAQELALMAEDAGCTVEELRATLAADPVTRAELVEAARVARRARERQEALTYVKL